MMKKNITRSALLFFTISFCQLTYADNFSNSKDNFGSYNPVLHSQFLPGYNNNFEEIQTKKATRFSGEVLTIDTRKQESCLAIQNQLREVMNSAEVETLCDENVGQPLVSVIRLDGRNETVEFSLYIDLSNSNKLVKETRNVGILGLGVMGAIFALPEEISHWDRKDMKLNVLGAKWKNNVRNGPVWDKDDLAINYIGHPYSGAVYYVVARHAGYSAWQSFGYSAIMSSFFWEYGLEAFAEKPSIQDLIVTPIIGALIGEKFYEWDKEIRAKDGELLNSKRLGSTALFLMNPAGEISKGMNKLIDNQNFIKDAKTYVVVRNETAPAVNGSNRIKQKDFIGLKFEFKF